MHAQIKTTRYRQRSWAAQVYDLVQYLIGFAGIPLKLRESFRPPFRVFFRVAGVKERLRRAGGRQTMNMARLLHMRLVPRGNCLAGRQTCRYMPAHKLGCRCISRYVKCHITFDQSLTSGFCGSAKQLSFHCRQGKCCPKSASQEKDLRSTTKYCIAEAASLTSA